MATVPGRSNVIPMMPEWAKPTQADFLQAAAIMHERDESQQVRFDKGVKQPAYHQTPDMIDQLKMQERDMEEEQKRTDEMNMFLKRDEGHSLRKKPKDEDI